MKGISAALGFLCVAFSAPAGAEVAIKRIEWHVLSEDAKHKAIYKPAQEWAQEPIRIVTRKPRAVITLVNKGPRLAEGILFRFAVSAKLVRIDRPDDTGVWTVPFWVDDHRVAWLKANETTDVNVDNLLLMTHFKKLFRAGFWPKAIRISAMVELRPGDSVPAPEEKDLAVVWTGEKKK
ncbi:MAG: hypothetical protein HY078_07305 [Elusimicrobia bacterium]|nr:hypothetical protein [Elusimicrobiota bacterium]